MSFREVHRSLELSLDLQGPRDILNPVSTAWSGGPRFLSSPGRDRSSLARARIERLAVHAELTVASESFDRFVDKVRSPGYLNSLTARWCQLLVPRSVVSQGFILVDLARQQALIHHVDIIKRGSCRLSKT